MFKEVGLECDMKLVGSSTKVLSFRKPLKTEKFKAPSVPPPDTLQQQQQGEAGSTAGEEQAEAVGTVLAS